MNLKSLEPLQRRIGHFPIELPAAALLAAALALVMFALPTWRFESLVAATGLPGVIGAAQPPLGQTARAVAAAVLSVLSFLGVFYGLRALDRRPAETDFPSFRAADAHPDAPRRRPILAGAEFGAPADDLPPIEHQLRRRKFIVSEPLPSFLAPQPPKIGDFVPDSAAEPDRAAAAEAEAAGLKPAHEAEPFETEPFEPQPFEAEPFAATLSDPSPPPSYLQPSDEPPSFLQPREEAPFAPQPQSRPQPDPADDFMEEPDAEDLGFESAEPLPRDGIPAAPRLVESPFDAPAPEADAVAVPEEDEEEPDESVSTLMARLESGLTRRGSKPQPTGSNSFAQEELQRALGDLNRVAGGKDPA